MLNFLKFSVFLCELFVSVLKKNQHRDASGAELHREVIPIVSKIRNLANYNSLCPKCRLTYATFFCHW